MLGNGLSGLMADFGEWLPFDAKLHSGEPAMGWHNRYPVEWAAANFFPVCRHIHVEDGFGPEEAGGQLFRRVLFRRLVHPQVSVFLSIVLKSMLGLCAWVRRQQHMQFLPQLHSKWRKGSA